MCNCSRWSQERKPFRGIVCREQAHRKSSGYQPFGTESSSLGKIICLRCFRLVSLRAGTSVEPGVGLPLIFTEDVLWPRRKPLRRQLLPRRRLLRRLSRRPLRRRSKFLPLLIGNNETGLPQGSPIFLRWGNFFLRCRAFLGLPGLIVGRLSGKLRRAGEASPQRSPEPA